MNASWIVVDHNVTISGNITCQGNVNLLLCDGVTLTCETLICETPNTLRIYGQANDSGKLIATSVEEDAAGIGCFVREHGFGQVTILGGTIIATGGEDGAGIGTGDRGTGGFLSIYGGRVTVTGGYLDAGIGSGYYYSTVDVTINGGDITVNGGDYGAGIGTGYNSSGSIIITGGNINATGGNYGAGIGGALDKGANITITGGTITATGGRNSAGTGIVSGIGNGNSGSGSVISLSWTNPGDSITANSYGGTVTLEKLFSDGTDNLSVGVVSDNAILAGKTLTPTRYLHHSLSLNGDIGVNFYIDLDGLDTDNVRIVFTWDGNSEEQKALTVPFGEAKDTENGVRFTCPISAAEMSDIITASLYAGDDLIETDTYSAVQYANVILNDADWIADYKAKENETKYNRLATVIKTMLNYGATAQTQFDHNAENPANAGIDYPLVALTEDELFTIPGVLPKTSDYDLSAYGLSFYGSSLLLKTKTTLRFYFKITDPDKYHAEDIKLGDITTVNPYGDGSKYVYIEAVGIAANDLNQTFALSVGSTSLGEYSVLSYVKDVLTDGVTGAPLSDTVTALYRFHKAAKAFFDTPVPEPDETEIRKG